MCLYADVTPAIAFLLFVFLGFLLLISNLVERVVGVFPRCANAKKELDFRTANALHERQLELKEHRKTKHNK